MTPVAAQPLPSSSYKMEDRKRSSQSVDDLAPPSKRQAVNGSSKALTDADMPWKDDLEKYQKDAIYRQMLEYKREKATLESQLKDIQKKSTDHDDHLRVVDAWWTQFLDEVKLLVEDEVPAPDDAEASFPTALNFKSSEEFTNHLASKSRDIKSRLEIIFANLGSIRGKPAADFQDLQTKLTNLLASQKDYMLKVDRLRTEKEELSERLETASLRYIKAEKRLDRAKSTAIAKLEQQAIAGTSNSAGSGIGGIDNGGDTEMTNGGSEEKNEATQSLYREASAVIAKQKEQLETISAENKTLTEQLTAATTRLTNISDDDYARTELFKQFRIQHEDVIRRINHLEATNIQLREEAERLQAERTSYRVQIENESEILSGELESQLQRVEADLTRIRSARDELVADVTMRKAAQDQDRDAIEQMKELVRAKEDRIAALQSEVERLRLQTSDQTCELTPRPEVDSLKIEDLRQKYEELRQQYDSINTELPALQSAYKRVTALSSKKVMDFTSLEEKKSMLIAEKSKADQKYFAARKDMDTRIHEVKTLRAQNAKSSEIITQLKEVETSNRNLLSNLEKQMSDLRQANTSTATENKRLEGSNREAISKFKTLESQVVDLTNITKHKDSAHFSIKERIMAVERESETLHKRVEALQKDRDHWKAKSMSKQSGEEEMLRTLALCTVCRNEFKNTALKTCGHLFCNTCVEDRLANRMRKCPNCAKPFDKVDVMTVHM